MPWRYWRIRTTSSRSVRATTLTQGGYSLIQYSGMTVPLGSSTRSTRTVYQGFLARYSRVRTFQGPGSSGSFGLGMRGLDDATRAGEHGAHHGGGQLAGVGVLAARVVAAEQNREAVAEAGLAAVAERGAGAGADAVGGCEKSQVGVVADLAQRDDDADAGEGGQLGGQVAAAAGDLVGRRLVVGRGAAGGGDDVGVAQGEAVVGALRGRDVGEALGVEGGEEEVARAVAGEDAAGAVGAVRGGGQADQQQARVGVAEAGDGLAP